jgi:hypothetical protein
VFTNAVQQVGLCGMQGYTGGEDGDEREDLVRHRSSPTLWPDPIEGRGPAVVFRSSVVQPVPDDAHAADIEVPDLGRHRPDAPGPDIQRLR